MQIVVPAGMLSILEKRVIELVGLGMHRVSHETQSQKQRLACHMMLLNQSHRATRQKHLSRSPFKARFLSELLQ